MDGLPTKTGISSLQIKTMMLNAQREIEERKRMLEALKKNPTKPLAPNTGTVPNNLGAPTPMMIDKEKPLNIAALQEQIRAKLAQNTQIVAPTTLAKPIPLILDSEGRTVDETGREVNVPQLVPTLKANIRAKKRETVKTHATEFHSASSTPTTKFHDDRIALKSSARPKRELRFHEPGKFVVMGERLRMKAQVDKLQNEISQIARKTGISSATKLALIAPKTDISLEEVPQMEWWDSVVLIDNMDTLDSKGEIAVREAAITNLIEHPTQIRPPNESVRPLYLPVFLTKKEQKKLRRQNRREAWKEEQEKIRLGLIEPPEPKLRISNIMRVLGNEAIQDPTKIEVHVRAQMEKRQKTHEEANQARKLTTEQRRDKKIRKLKEDTSMGVQVSVYRVRDLTNVSKKFKVETNAKQLLMTGIVVLFKDCCVVVVEGGPKQQKKYRRLMLNRVKWEEDIVKDLDGHEVPNCCSLVWQGIVPRRNFGEMKFKTVANEKAARELFQKFHVEHYWDLAYSGAVLEANEDL